MNYLNLLKKGRYFIYLAILLNLLNYSFKNKFLINLTASIPRGIYLTSKDKELKIGDIVAFNTQNYKIILDYRNSQETFLFCKRIVGKEGSEIKVIGNELFIDNNKISEILFLNKNNEKLPQVEEFKEGYSLKENEFFLLGDTENSFDSRYYGPVKKEDIIYKLTPFLVEGGEHEKKKK